MPKRPDDAVLRVNLHYDNVASFVEQFAGNVSAGGVFIPSRSTYPLGGDIHFELHLRDGKPVLRGEGRVVWQREFDPKKRSANHGVGVSITGLEPQSRTVFHSLLERRARGVQRPAVEPDSLEAFMIEHGIDEDRADRGVERLRALAGGLGLADLEGLAATPARAEPPLSLAEVRQRLDGLLAVPPPARRSTAPPRATRPEPPRDTRTDPRDGAPEPPRPALDPAPARPVLPAGRLTLTPAIAVDDLEHTEQIQLEAAPENLTAPRLEDPTLQGGPPDEVAEAVAEFQRRPAQTVMDSPSAPRPWLNREPVPARPPERDEPTLVPTGDDDDTSPQDLLPELQPETPGARPEFSKERTHVDARPVGFFRRLFGTRKPKNE